MEIEDVFRKREDDKFEIVEAIVFAIRERCIDKMFDETMIPIILLEAYHTTFDIIIDKATEQYGPQRTKDLLTSQIKLFTLIMSKQTIKMEQMERKIQRDKRTP